MRAADLVHRLAFTIPPGRFKTVLKTIYEALAFHKEMFLFRRSRRRTAASPANHGVLPGGSVAGTFRSHPEGINLVGYARAESGLGEFLRMSAKALDEGPIPFCVVNFDANLPPEQLDRSLESCLSDRNPYRVNLFHVAPDTMPLVWRHFGPEFFQDRYNIGFWLWELDACPREWLPVLDLVDEVWAPTRFVQKVFTAETSKPVLRMPLGVSAELRAGYRRRDFHLADDRYLFLFCFDWYSVFERKNPHGCVAAFKRAFPAGDEPVGLVIKSVNGDPRDLRWRRLVKAMEDDPRIVLVNEAYTREWLLGLMSVCDCFLSLHRAEGFGYGPAEAMLLQKPVIATDYSGTGDFMLAAHSCPVDWRLIPVKWGEFRFASGKNWAEPDIDQASRYMRRLAGDPEYGRRLGRSARAYILEHYSPQAVGRCYHQRLAELQMV